MRFSKILPFTCHVIRESESGRKGAGQWCGTAAAHLLVHPDTHCVLRHIVNDTSSAVVMFEGHALVLRGVTFDVDVVSTLNAQSRTGDRENESDIARREFW